jgi:transcriptional regulator with XRE-family HTH domain
VATHDFATRCRRARQARGVSLYRLAQLTGLTREGLRLLELPGSDPKLSTVYVVAEKLGAPVAELLGLDAAGRPAEPPAEPPEAVADDALMDRVHQRAMREWRPVADAAILACLADGTPHNRHALGWAVMKASKLEVPLRFYWRVMNARYGRSGRTPPDVEINRAQMEGSELYALRRVEALRKRRSLRIEVSGPAGERTYRLLPGSKGKGKAKK